MKKISFLLLSMLAMAPVWLQAQTQCDAQFTATPAPSGDDLLRVQFTNTSLNSSGPGTYSLFVFSFGDGSNTSNFTSTPHLYAAPGTYYTMLIMTKYDSLNQQTICTDTMTQLVAVAYPACGATISKINNGNGSYTFTAINPAGTSGMSYSWNFGDGNTGTGSPVTHTYTSGGTYTVGLQATGGGCTYNNTTGVQYNVANCDSLNANFYVTISGTTASFYNTSTASPGNYANSYWDFGDGNTGTAATTGHVYAAAGIYPVSLTTVWTDSFSMAFICADTIWQNITINIINCDSLNTSFDVNVTGMTADFTSTATIFPGVNRVSSWGFGDGYGATGDYTSHTYTAPGTYTVSQTTLWQDSLTLATVCSDTTWLNVTVNSQLNLITGNIYWDTLAGTPDSIKVWLIVHDSVANTLTAVDSQTLSSFSPHYVFYGHSAGSYRVKAAVPGQPASTTGWVPTYHYSSLYWNTANVILHTGGTTNNKHIMLQIGTVTAGPGFIGGNISLGAGKGTATGVPDMLVFLRKANSELVTATYTDADGNYSFSDIPEGSYNVYPEAMNYATTPSATITIAAGQVNSHGNDFEQNESEIVPLNGLSISGLRKEDGIAVYPNPVEHTLFIESRNNTFNQVTVMNTLGQVVLQQALKQGINKVETAGLSTGTYYLLIKGDKALRSMKVTKK